MKKLLWFIMGGIALAGLLYSCRVAYTPPAITVNSNYLVVDGIINSGNTDSTVIKLSRTVPLSGSIGTITETKAKVTVESNANSTTYALNETVKGTYISPGHLNLDKTAQYRLRIITSAGKTYLSDFVPVKEAPPIDSVGYTLPANGVHIYVNTHDATNNTRYYRWEYTETWNFHSLFPSIYMVVGNTIVCRPPDQQIGSCWASNNSTDIVLASSAKLTNDVIFKAPIAAVPAASEKLSIKYSILVKQYALTEDAFSFWQLTQTNTQQLGSIFDAQPSMVKSNIHNINDSTEPVLGYISVGTATQKRIFIDYFLNLPPTWGRDTSAYGGCQQVTVASKDYAEFFDGSYIPTYPPQGVPPSNCDVTPGSLMGSTPGCVDCTLRGTNKKPPFWPN